MPLKKKANWLFVQKFLKKRGYALPGEDVACLCTVSVSPRASRRVFPKLKLRQARLAVRYIHRRGSIFHTTTGALDRQAACRIEDLFVHEIGRRAREMPSVRVGTIRKSRRERRARPCPTRDPACNACLLCESTHIPFTVRTVIIVHRQEVPPFLLFSGG